MRFPPDYLFPFIKAVLVGGLTGLVLGVMLLVLPSAIFLIVIGAMDVEWDLSWFPDVEFLMFLGIAVGAVYAGVLFIKDRHIPYVEDVPDFEEDSDRDIS